MQNRYKHSMSAKELRESAKANPTGSIIPLQEIYTDQVSAKNKTTGEWEGLRTFYKDSGRDVKLNGVSIASKIKELKGEENSPEFKALISQELGVDPAVIDVAYGQNLQSILTHPLSNNFDIGMVSGRSFSLGYASADSGREANIYQENGEVYCKIKIREYHVSESFELNPDGQGKNLILPGPVEVLYKLEQDPADPSKKLFALQHIATDSDLVRSVFLGENTGLANKLKSSLVDVTPEVQAFDIRNIFLYPKNIIKASTTHMNRDLIEAQYAQGAALVEQYEKGQLSTNQLVERLERILPIVETAEKDANRRQSFIKKHTSSGKEKPATTAVQEAINMAKKLPGYKPTLSQGVENKSPTNDAKVEKSESPVKMRLGRGSSSA